MDQNQFRRLIQSGFGRAILYAREHDASEFQDLILDACLHCYSYDPQVEGTRANYMLEIVDLTSEREFYHNEVLSALSPSGDDYDTVQRFRFAARLAFDGNDRAKRAMYESYQPGPKMGEEIAVEFVQMDGIDGLLFAAGKIGALLTSSPEEVDLGLLMSVSGDELGEQKTRDALREAGKTSPQIEAYRLAAEAADCRLDERVGKSSDLLHATYEDVRSKLSETTFPWLWNWGERASDADLKGAARGLIAAREAKDQHDHLRIFGRRRFPLDVQVLLDLVEVEQHRVGFAAIKALAQIIHPKVRELAFRLVESRAKLRGETIKLLAQIFEPGDHKIVLGWFESEQDADVRHSFGLDLPQFWDRHPDGGTEILMSRAMYEKGQCGNCREHVVRRLVEQNSLPDDMRAECAYDANQDIRELVNAPPTCADG